MRSIRALAVIATAVAVPVALAAAPAALADYAVNAAVTMSMDQPQGNSAMTQYGQSRTITFTITNAGDADAGRPQGTVNFTVSPDLGASFTSSRSVTAEPGDNALQSKASLTFNANVNAAQSYTVTANFVAAAAQPGQDKFADASKVGYVTIFPRATRATLTPTSGTGSQNSRGAQMIVRIDGDNNGALMNLSPSGTFTWRYRRAGSTDAWTTATGVAINPPATVTVGTTNSYNGGTSIEFQVTSFTPSNSTNFAGLVATATGTNTPNF